MLVLSRNEVSYPMTVARVALNRPCWDMNAHNAPWRDDIDDTFQHKANTCTSDFKGSKGDTSYNAAGLKINEYEILKENGLIKKLEAGYSGSFSSYESAAHKKYNYNLWEKDYTYWNPKCTRDNMGVDKFEIISNQASGI